MYKITDIPYPTEKGAIGDVISAAGRRQCSEEVIFIDPLMQDDLSCCAIFLTAAVERLIRRN